MFQYFFWVAIIGGCFISLAHFWHEYIPVEPRTIYMSTGLVSFLALIFPFVFGAFGGVVTAVIYFPVLGLTVFFLSLREERSPDEDLGRGSPVFEGLVGAVDPDVEVPKAGPEAASESASEAIVEERALEAEEEEPAPEAVVEELKPEAVAEEMPVPEPAGDNQQFDVPIESLWEAAAAVEAEEPETLGALLSLEECVSKGFDAKCQGDLGLAAFYFDEALAKGPDDDLAFFLALDLSTIWNELGQLEKAVEVLQQFLDGKGEIRPEQRREVERHLSYLSELCGAQPVGDIPQ